MNFGSIDSQFGQRPGQLSEDEAHAILDRYLELGGNCIDTSDFFPWFGPDAGKTESIIGNWLAKQDRTKVYLITKVRMPIDVNNINSTGLSRNHIVDSVNWSLKRLQTDYIDMLVLHGWDNSVSFSETVRNIDDLVRIGQVRYVGVCDFKGWQLQRFIDSAKLLNLHKCVCYMGEYNLLTRGCELEVLDVCKKERIGFIAYSPLKYGFLSDESVASGLNSPVSGSRIEAANSNNLAAMAEPWSSMRRNPINMNVLNYCHLLSRKYRVTVSQIAIQWLLQSGVVTSICVGVESAKQLEDIMYCLVGEFSLTQEDMEELNFVSTVYMHYPYHKQLAEIIGMKTIRPIKNKTEFEQLGVQLTAGEQEFFEPKESGMQRLNLRDTVHEAYNQSLPEQQFLTYIQDKSRSGLLRSEQFQQQPNILSGNLLPAQSQYNQNEQGRSYQ
jgi:aryl-alcohol dehydrogenase-like predicted oxidoreductase